MTEIKARNFIYMKESSDRLDAVNSIGCKGLGQDCNGQLEIQCPDWKTNRQCQNAFWDNYAVNRYGGWVQSYNFWIENNWW